MAKKYFKEEQRFNNQGFTWCIAILLIAATAMLIRGILYPETFNSLYIGAFAALFISCGIVLWYVTHLRMSMKVTDKGITIQRSSFNTSKEKIKWNNIERIDEISHSELQQWSGSNIHFGDEKFYSLNGRNGISVHTTQGQKYFIGTKRLPELSAAIRSIFEQRNPA